jgi:uncharacterized protein YkwD
MRLAVLASLIALVAAAPAQATMVPQSWHGWKDGQRHGRFVPRSPLRPTARPAARPAAPAAAPAPAPALAPAPAAAPAAAPAPAPAPAALTAAEAELLTAVNQARAAAGLAPLAIDASLQTAARAHTQNLLDNGAFTHDFLKDGASVPFSGWIGWYYRGSCAGENLASGSPSLSAAQAVELWLASPAHRANMLSARFTTVGIALAARNGTVVATTDFGGC